MQVHKILFPVDFSERSHAIVPCVQAACERFHASLTLLHLVQAPPAVYRTPDAPVIFDFPIEEIREMAGKELAEFAKEFRGVPVEIVIEEGDPGSCIAEWAEVWKTDLIMMPTRGRGRFRAALLGSTTAKTLHDANCAIWTAAHCEAPVGHIQWQSVICAIDTVSEGERLIRFAAEFAPSVGKIQLAHAVPTGASGASEYWDFEFNAFLKDKARQTIAEMQKRAGTSFDLCLDTGPVTEVVCHAAKTHSADLVIIGRGVLPRFAGGLRSHAYALVREMPCPVLSV